MKAVILAAGVGSRLGRPLPKCLCKLPDGNTILSRQIQILREHNIREIYIVVGFKMTLIMEQIPNIFFRYNPLYYITNTAKSLLTGLDDFEDDVIWMNGDVIFDSEVIKRIIKQKGNLVGVNRNKCGQEEIKYSLDKEGNIVEISKAVQKGLGEAVGINKISARDIPVFKQYLRDCAYNDYFEEAIELAIKKNVIFKPIDVSDVKCIEVDFSEDFDRALDLFFGKH